MRNPKTVTFKEGEIIFREGEYANCAYIIIEGNVDIRIATDNGLRTIATIGHDNLLGEMSLLDGKPRSATAVAMDEVRCYKLSKYHFDRIYGYQNSVARKLGQIQNQRIRNLNDQLRH